jgi:hypothetical protein
VLVQTLARLTAFQAKMRSEVQAAASAPDSADDGGSGGADAGGGPAAAEKPRKHNPIKDGYSGEVMADDDDEDDAGWMRNKLKFVKHLDDKFRTDVRSACAVLACVAAGAVDCELVVVAGWDDHTGPAGWCGPSVRRRRR